MGSIQHRGVHICPVARVGVAMTGFNKSAGQCRLEILARCRVRILVLVTHVESENTHSKGF
jgi:hypothetical protein